ncbi:MAG: MATE family efflux transporter [Thermoanaerobaculia bacterium]
MNLDATRREIGRLTRLSLPVAATQLSSMLLWTIDLLMVGRLGTQAINAVSLGRLWVIGTAIVGMGVLYGLDTIAAQAHGARDREKLGETLLHGAALALLVALPIAALWLFTGPILLAFGQDPATVAVAHRYAVVQIPALPFYFLFVVLKQYLQARGIVRPAMWVSFAACVLNAGLNWVLIWGHFGLPRLGAVGTGVATAITEVAMLAALLAIVARYGLQRGSRTILSPRRIRRHGLGEILGLGLPVAFQLACEYWAFAMATLWAGWLGPLDLAAHSIALNLASITYMVPLGISFGASTRVGNRIGAGDPAGAQRAAWVAFGLGGAVMAVFALLFVAGRRMLPAAYIADPELIEHAAAILPIAAAFELFDGLQVVGGGILRGMGATRAAAVINFLGYYALAMPLAWWLGARARFGLEGIWWGLALGLALVAILMLARVARRGPRTAVSIVSSVR